MSLLPCGGALNPAKGLIMPPDRDGDGLYDFNLECFWSLEVMFDTLIHFSVIYTDLDPCDDDSDYLEVSLCVRDLHFLYFIFLAQYTFPR